MSHMDEHLCSMVLLSAKKSMGNLKVPSSQWPISQELMPYWCGGIGGTLRFPMKNSTNNGRVGVIG